MKRGSILVITTLILILTLILSINLVIAAIEPEIPLGEKEKLEVYTNEILINEISSGKLKLDNDLVIAEIDKRIINNGAEVKKLEEAGIRDSTPSFLEIFNSDSGKNIRKAWFKMKGFNIKGDNPPFIKEFDGISLTISGKFAELLGVPPAPVIGELQRGFGVLPLGDLGSGGLTFNVEDFKDKEEWVITEKGLKNEKADLTLSNGEVTLNKNMINIKQGSSFIGEFSYNGKSFELEGDEINIEIKEKGIEVSSGDNSAVTSFETNMRFEGTVFISPEEFILRPDTKLYMAEGDHAIFEINEDTLFFDEKTENVPENLPHIIFYTKENKGFLGDETNINIEIGGPINRELNIELPGGIGEEIREFPQITTYDLKIDSTKSNGNINLNLQDEVTLHFNKGDPVTFEGREVPENIALSHSYSDPVNKGETKTLDIKSRTIAINNNPVGKFIRNIIEFFRDYFPGGPGPA